MEFLTLPLLIWFIVSICGSSASSTASTCASSGVENFLFLLNFLNLKTKNQFIPGTSSIFKSPSPFIFIVSLAWQPKGIVRTAQRGRCSRIPIDTIKFHVIQNVIEFNYKIKIPFIWQLRNDSCDWKSTGTTGKWARTLQLFVGSASTMIEHCY